MDGDDEAAKPEARKHKLSEREALFIYDEDAERNIRKAARIFRDELLPVPYEILDVDKKGKADKAEEKMFEQLRYLLGRKKKLRVGKSDPRFNRTFFDAEDYSVFQSSQESDSTMSVFDDPPAYPAGDPDAVLASAEDVPAEICESLLAL